MLTARRNRELARMEADITAREQECAWMERQLSYLLDPESYWRQRDKASKERLSDAQLPNYRFVPWISAASILLDLGFP